MTLSASEQFNLDKVTAPTWADTLNDCEPLKAHNPWNGMIGGSHYLGEGEQPLQRTLSVKGYDAFAGACYTKVTKYTSRIKDNEVEQLKKARHVLDLWIYEAERKQC
jgi:hypothetical protein